MRQLDYGLGGVVLTRVPGVLRFRTGLFLDVGQLHPQVRKLPDLWPPRRVFAGWQQFSGWDNSAQRA
eukprot:3797455-Rhodomonas_salina.1